MVGMVGGGASFLKDMSFWTTDNVVGGAAAPASGQGFSMSSDEMRAMLAKAQGTRKLIQSRLFPARKLAQAESPADVPPSNAAVHGPNGINETGEFYGGHLQVQYNYYTSLIVKMEAALGMTEEADRLAGDAAKQAGGEL